VLGVLGVFAAGIPVETAVIPVETAVIPVETAVIPVETAVIPGRHGAVWRVADRQVPPCSAPAEVCAAAIQVVRVVYRLPKPLPGP